jgi:hypothetical protein
MELRKEKASEALIELTELHCKPSDQIVTSTNGCFDACMKGDTAAAVVPDREINDSVTPALKLGCLGSLKFHL